MALTLKFGSYSHALGEASVRINTSCQFDRSNRPIKLTTTWDIAARAEGTDTDDLLTNLAKAVRGYDARNQRVSARLETAGGVICHELNGPRSIGGIRIEQPPSFPDATGAQLTTYRDYSVRLAADYFVGNPARMVVSFNETLSFEGGGPDRGMIEVTTGPPLDYLTIRQTAFRCAQSGNAVGFTAYPVWLLRPAFPIAFFEGRQPPVVYAAPEAEGGADINFGLSWSYRFVSNRPLAALPRPFPR